MLLAFFTGMAIGIFCGIMPGIHPNTAIPFILWMSFAFSPVDSAVVLLSAGVSNSFVSFIPAILLGAPESDSALSVLPGHRLLLQGRGLEAIRLTVFGGLGAVFFVIATLPAFAVVVPPLYAFIRPSMHLILIFVACYMIISERNRPAAAALFVLSGMLGYFSEGLGDMLFPMLTGLFGMPSLFVAMHEKVRQRMGEMRKPRHVPLKMGATSVVIGSVAGIVAGLMPGIGSSQATVLVNEAVSARHSDEKFLMASACVNVSDIIYSLFAIYLIGNPRSGIAVAIGDLVSVGASEMLFFIGIIIVSSLAAAAFTVAASRMALSFIRRMNYAVLCKLVFIFLWIMVAVLSGISGLAVAFAAFLIGMIPMRFNVRRSLAMGCLMLPTILWFALR